MKNILVFVGSLRAESINRKYAHALENLAAGKLAFTYADLDLPLYNDDLWQSPPEKIVKLKEQIKAADGILFVTPEYNRSLPAVTKNAVDWGSRPFGQSAWAGKAVAITGASPGAIGTAVAQSQLRSSLVILETHVMGGPEVYFTFKPDLIDDDGNVLNDRTVQFLSGFIDKFADWVGKFSI
jgi:chromate reductase, NAD(P)H dehydrogenase (quinone)